MRASAKPNTAALSIKVETGRLARWSNAHYPEYPYVSVRLFVRPAALSPRLSRKFGRGVNSKPKTHRHSSARLT
jgi:hypothetical protein